MRPMAASCLLLHLHNGVTAPSQHLSLYYKPSLVVLSSPHQHHHPRQPEAINHARSLTSDMPAREDVGRKAPGWAAR